MSETEGPGGIVYDPSTTTLEMATFDQLASEMMKRNQATSIAWMSRRDDVATDGSDGGVTFHGNISDVAQLVVATHGKFTANLPTAAAKFKYHTNLLQNVAGKIQNLADQLGDKLN